MTEQADILATGNKSPDSTPSSRCPVAGVPASWSEQRLCRLPSSQRPPLESCGGGLALGGPHLLPCPLTHPPLLSPCPEFHPPQLVPEQVLHQGASGRRTRAWQGEGFLADPQYAERLLDGAFKKRRCPGPHHSLIRQATGNPARRPMGRAATVNTEAQQLREFEEATGGSGLGAQRGQARA